MASCSQVPQIKHDVFISFRGTDTRRGFVSHLNVALCQKKIDVYVDEKLERGDEISAALLRAIETSQISLIIFSEDYASSKWCLDELVKIMECHERGGQVVIPIFYDTDPSHVRYQNGSYEKAFSEYGKKFEDNMAKVQEWRNALTKAANVSGFHSSNFGTEADLIKQIVERVLKRLKHIYMGQNNAKVLVGIHEEVALLESLAVIDSEAVRIIGIWGMGGVGKTTIAKALYERLRFEYEASCFVPNVREKLGKYEVTLLQNELVCALLEEKDRSICIPIEGCEYNMMRLRRKKVLLVLDDVDDLTKLKNLYGGRGWFGPGSRVIVTSRDKQVFATEVDYTYEVKALKFEDSLQLFSLNAFKEICPKLEWMDLSKRALNYAQGIPLVIEVLGSSLYGQEREMWESQLEKLKRMPIPEIQNVLRLSYDGLDREEQDIFLYLACFFVRSNLRTSLLDDCGYSTQAGLTKLCNKALLAVHYPFHNKVKHWNWTMHDLVRCMGKEIICGESRDPGNRRHLWDPHDVYQVLENATGTGAIQSLTLDMGSTSKELHLSPKAFNGMFNLKFLELHTYDFISQKRKMFAPKSLESIPDGLRRLCWVGCPLKSLPSSFRAENLVELDLSDSSLERLWDGVQNLVKLERINLSGCEQLTELPDFSKAFKLREVYLDWCTRLCALHPPISSFQLMTLYLNVWKKLKSIWSDLHLNNISSLSLKELHLSPKAFYGMFNLKFLQLRTYYLKSQKGKVIAPKNLESMTKGLRVLYWEGCPLKSLPSSFCAENLVKLDLSHSSLERLWDGVQNLVKLKRIVLGGCEQLMELPDFSKAFNLRDVDLSMCTSLCDLHPSIFSLHLYWLDLKGCKKLKSLWSDLDLNNISRLSAKGCSSINEFSVLPKKLEFLNSEFSKRLPYNFLQVLDLWEMRKFTLDFFAPRYFLQWLSILRLSGCNIETLPTTIKHLSWLYQLDLEDCTMLRFLPELPPSVYKLRVGNCVSLEEASISTVNGYSDCGPCFKFRNCCRLNQRTLNTIMSDALVKMKQAAYIDRLELRPFRNIFLEAIGVDLPGSKLPADRCDFRTTTEATLTIQLSPLSRFLGLIFGLVISQLKPTLHPGPNVRCRCNLQTSNGPEVNFETNIGVCFWSFTQYDSDHVFLWHQRGLFMSEIENIIKSSADNQCRTYNAKLSITISTKWEIEVKEWGIYPIYASDLFNFSDQLALDAKTEIYRETDELLDKESLPPAKKLKTEWKKILEFEPTA